MTQVAKKTRFLRSETVWDWWEGARKRGSWGVRKEKKTVTREAFRRASDVGGGVIAYTPNLVIPSVLRGATRGRISTLVLTRTRADAASYNSNCTSN